MSPERFSAVRALFEMVIELPASERESALRAQAADADLIAEVLALCRRADRDSTTRFSESRDAMLQIVASPSVKPGDSLGVWRIIRPLGEGGMGKVFQVERNDGHFQQTAALKFLKGIPRPDTLDYFTRERQLLATLTHPNIARLLDGGATAAGQPYLVMEFIDGLPIDTWIRAQRLDLRSLLTLFIRACDAVSFAHRQLIVHCDIKPSNLLIDSTGRPVLLDFGIATLMDRVGASAETGAMPSGAAFTPRYASPEQREKGMVSTASDIYSLGVLLRELLESAVQDDAHAAHSPELVAILDFATRQEPAKRYVSVDAFTDDIQRYLQQQPVRALPATPVYIARKWLIRRWPVAVATAAFAATVAGFTAQVLVESRRAQMAELQALADRDRAQSAEQSALRERDGARLARNEALLERDRTAQAERLAAQQRDRAKMAERLAAQQRDRAQIAETRAVMDRDSARKAEAAALAERNRATQAEARTRQTNDFLVSIFESTQPNAESGDIPASKLVAAASERIEKDMSGQPETQGTLWGVLAKVHTKMGNSERARDDYLRSIELERKLDRPLLLAGLLHDLAMLRVSELGTPGAEAEAREALALYEKHAPGSADAAGSMASLGHLLSILGKHEEGGKLLKQALALHESADPPHQSLARTLNMLGQHAMRVRDHEAAVTYFERGIEVRSTRLGPDHPLVLNDEELYVRALMATRKLDEAERRARRVLAIRTRLYGAESSNVGSILNELGRVLVAQGRIREGLSSYEESAAIHAKRNGRQSTRYALMLNNMAVAQMFLGNMHKAADQLGEAVVILDKVIPGEQDPGKTGFIVNLGLVLLTAGRHAEALPVLERGHASRSKILKADNPDLVETELYLADAELHTGKVEQATARLSKIDPNLKGISNAQKFSHRRLNALVAARRGDLDLAIEQLAAVDAERFKTRDMRSVAAWTAMLDRAELLLKRNRAGDRDTAQDILKLVQARLNELSLPDAPAAIRTRRLLAE